MENSKQFFTKKFYKKIMDILRISIGGSAIFSVLAVYNHNEKFYKSFLMPFVHKLDPENAHRISIIGAKYFHFKQHQKTDVDLLKTSAFGLAFSSPIGLAAGYDKHGEAVSNLFKMGFSFVEVGSVTPLPQPGNPKPRVFRLENSKGIINRYGFNSDGHEIVYQRLDKLPPSENRNGVLGINLGKNKESSNTIDDYVSGVKKFGQIADYLVINVSSPNTPGLRNMQQNKELEALTSSVLKAKNELPEGKRPAILLKISPDLNHQDLKDIAQVVTKDTCRMDGLIISNTTISRPSYIEDAAVSENGGLSGQPLKEISTNVIRSMAILTKGQVPIIGVGGIGSGKDALDKIYNGACMVQLYSSFAYEGPPIVDRISKELAELLRKDGYHSVKDAIGAKLK